MGEKPSNAGERPDATVEDVANHFGVSVRTVRRWVADTAIPHRRVGGTLRFRMDEVDSWAARGGASKGAA